MVATGRNMVRRDAREVPRIFGEQSSALGDARAEDVDVRSSCQTTGRSGHGIDAGSP